MKRLLLLAAVLTACGSPSSRIKKNQAAYDSWPPAVQARVKEGKADVGFTAEQVRVALGKPDRVYTRKTSDKTQEIWAYGARGARTGVGLGFGMGGGSSSYGLGLGVGGPSSYPDDDKTRVVFEGDAVVSIESRDK